MSAIAAVPLPDRYDDRGLLGSGAMGQVRRARDEVLGCDVAIKVLHPELASRQGPRARFLTEARLTARLRHPGIVAVHDLGELPGGLVWFSMQLVEGRTLRDLVALVHRASEGRRLGRTADGWGLIEMIDVVARVCEAVGYAHDQGVIHRDLKPSNIMIGAFREVLLMDWGIARGRGLDEDDPTEPDLGGASLHRTAVGRAVGTPPYMSPEQARGDSKAVGPHSDVYALGAVLYKVLSGRSPYRGDPSRVVVRVAQGPPAALRDVCIRTVPRELIALCERAMSRRPEHRPASARELGEGLRAWLDRARRVEEAMAHVRAAREVQVRLDELDQDEVELGARVRAAAAAVQTWEPAAQKRVVWDAEDALADLRRLRRREEVEYTRRLRAALAGVPDLGDARALLADLYRRRAERAADDPIAEEAARAQVGLFDVGRHAAWLQGTGRLTLDTEPAGATVTAFRVQARGFRIHPERHMTLGRTPLVGAALDHGSWLLELRAPGRDLVRLPLHMPREAVRPEPPPGEGVTAPVWLPPEGAIRDDECYVPAGWCRIGGGFGCEAFPPRRVWIDGFVMRRNPTTLGEWIEFLEARMLQGQSIEGATCDGRVAVGARGPHLADGSDPEEPATDLSWRWARAFARWRALVDRQPWRLPHELEWEKAARGVDGRSMPWGDSLDPALARVLGSGVEGGMVPVSAFPSDVSVYGVRHLVGNVRDFCGNAWRRDPPPDGARVEVEAATGDEPFVALRGGCWRDTPTFFVPGSRFAHRPDRGGHATIGFRLVRSVP